MSLMDNLLGILRVRVQRGVNLAVRDVSSSDPYVVLKLGRQKLKTKVVKQNVNPQWQEDLSFTVTDPNLPLTLVNSKSNHYFLNRGPVYKLTHRICLNQNRLCTITTSSAKTTKWETQRSI
jgi:hypothetical protein